MRGTPLFDSGPVFKIPSSSRTPWQLQSWGNTPHTGFRRGTQDIDVIMDLMSINHTFCILGWETCLLITKPPGMNLHDMHGQHTWCTYFFSIRRRETEESELCFTYTLESRDSHQNPLYFSPPWHKQAYTSSEWEALSPPISWRTTAITKSKIRNQQRKWTTI
jgi:hypothetical protein